MGERSGNMGLPIHEQETNINFMRDEDIAVIYTSDSTTITKMDKKVFLFFLVLFLKVIHRLLEI